jgi:hypothetical protein
VNQLNRIKLMISTAFLQHEAGLEDVDAEFDPTENAGGGCGSCPISGLAGDSVPNRASGKVLLGMPMMRR